MSLGGLCVAPYTVSQTSGRVLRVRQRCLPNGNRSAGRPTRPGPVSRRGFRSALLFLFGRYKHLNGRPSSCQMVLGAGLEPARMRLAGTSPCLRYSESHGAERYNSGSSQRVTAGVSSRRQTWLSNPRSAPEGKSRPTPISPALTSQEIHLSFAFFRVSFRFAAPSRRAVEPPPRVCHFPPAQVKSKTSGCGLPAPLCSAPDAPAPPSGEPLRPLTAGQSENGAPCGSRTRDLAVPLERGLLFAPGGLRERLPGSGTEPRQRGHEHALPTELTVHRNGGAVRESNPRPLRLPGWPHAVP